MIDVYAGTDVCSQAHLPIVRVVLRAAFNLISDASEQTVSISSAVLNSTPNAFQVSGEGPLLVGVKVLLPRSLLRQSFACGALFRLG
jgi:hypothetical protein